MHGKTPFASRLTHTSLPLIARPQFGTLSVSLHFSSYPASTPTMMNFRVAPILPMSFGSHGDLPVLTKRTI
jgi:hypothetical protein